MEISILSIALCSLPILICIVIGIWVLTCKPNGKDKELILSEPYNDSAYPSSRIRCMSMKEKTEYVCMLLTAGSGASLAFSLATRDVLMVSIFAVIFFSIVIVVPVTYYLARFFRNEVKRRK